ncbi:MAG: hypothetical protein ACI4G0_03335, partial [Ruminococcus sp.]
MPICAIILQRARKYPTENKKQNLGEFTAELKNLFLEAEVGVTFPGLVRGKQSARLSAEHIKPSEARTHFNT